MFVSLDVVVADDLFMDPKLLSCRSLSLFVQLLLLEVTGQWIQNSIYMVVVVALVSYNLLSMEQANELL